MKTAAADGNSAARGGRLIHMKRVSLAIAVVALLAASCGRGETATTGTVAPDPSTPPDGGAQLAALATARQLWTAAPADYTVSVGTETLAVRGGEVVSLSSAEATTIDDVFGTIERSIRAGAVVDVEYDEDLGFPTRLVIDLDGDGTADVDLTFRDLEAMPIVRTLEQLLDARALWAAQGLETYRYIFRADCTCPDGGTFDVEVRDGRVTRFLPLDEAAAASLLTPTSIATAFDDLEEWFTDSADLIDEGILAVDVRMDPELGYPRWFHVEADAIDGGPFDGPFTIVVTIDLVLPYVPIADDPGGGTTTSADGRSLRQARARWEQAALQDYRYLFELHCECPLARAGPFEITVRGGEFWSSIGPLDGSGPVPDTVMIDDLFEAIAISVDAGIDVEVSYDDTWGYPRRALIDTEAVAVDGGLAFSISEFERIDKLGFISGTVVAGPQCPVQQHPPQPGCEAKPVGDAAIIITSHSFGGVPVPIVTDRNGGFFIALEPGEYVVTAQALPEYLGTPEPVTVTVRPGAEEKVELHYDTGIR